MEKGLISIILPVRNGEKTIVFAINSIIHQTYKNWELLIIDDGSDDNTRDIVRNINDERIVILGDSDHKGLPKRLNEGVGFARGEYIARMDADDICYANRFEKQIEFLKKNIYVDLVGTAAIVWTNDGIPLKILRGPNLHKDIISWKVAKSIPIIHPTFMGKSAWFKKNPYDEVLRAEDQALLLKTSEFARFANIDEILLGYYTPNVRTASKVITGRIHYGYFFSKYNFKRLKLGSILLYWFICIGKIMLDYLNIKSQRVDDMIDKEILENWKALYCKIKASNFSKLAV